MEVTIESMVNRWSGLERPLFRGKLIDKDGCKCAQGDVLACAGYTDEQLRNLEQLKADVAWAAAGPAAWAPAWATARAAAWAAAWGVTEDDALKRFIRSLGDTHAD